jgi:hypothetical protein
MKMMTHLNKGGRMRKTMAIFLIATWIVAIFYLMFGIHLPDIENRMENLREERSKWPAVPGIVTNVDSHVADITDDNDRDSVSVSFQYKVSNVTLNSHQYWYYTTKTGYTKGQSITVYYNPMQNKEAVLDPKNVDVYEVSKWWETILRILAMPAIIFGCMFIWSFVTAGKKHNVPDIDYSQRKMIKAKKGLPVTR